MKSSLLQRHSFTPLIKPTPIRVLHVVGGMNAGGVETWLLQVLQNIDRDRFQVDFWVHSNQDCLYDSEVRALGSQIIVAPRLTSPWAYARSLHKLLRQPEPYHVIHSHVHHFSGVILKIAHQAKVPVRIAHSHLDSSHLDRHPNWRRQLYLALSHRWLQRYATVGLSVSGLAATSLFGHAWQRDPRWKLLHCGINLQPFRTVIAPSSLREQFQIPADAFVIGHVGRFEPQKNHDFLVQIAAQVMQHQPNTYLFLIGQGARLPQIQAQVDALGIRDRVVFAGVRRDVPQLMQGVMDVFVLPSWQEGLPLVLIEAQAAGLPCLISNTITPEVEMIAGLIRRYPLQYSAEQWKNALFDLAKSAPARTFINRLQQLDTISQSTFNIESCVQALESIYFEKFEKMPYATQV